MSSVSLPALISPSWRACLQRRQARYAAKGLVALLASLLD
jgi:hypothetical protein